MAADKIRKAIEILSGLAEYDDDQPGPSSGSSRNSAISNSQRWRSVSIGGDQTQVIRLFSWQVTTNTSNKGTTIASHIIMQGHSYKSLRAVAQEIIGFMTVVELMHGVFWFPC